MNDTSQGALYGRGIFTTIAFFGGELFLWEKHWRRLAANAARAGIALDEFSQERVKAFLREAIERGKVIDGRVRLTFRDERPADIWAGDDANDENTTMSIIVGERRPVPRPFKCSVSSYAINSASPLTGVKSCNYLENLLAMEDAKRRGSHEAIRLNERGRIAGACMANVFWLRDGRLFTPSLATGCLPGTTREFVLENIECEEVQTEIREVETADSVFLTSAGLGVVAVDDFNGRRMPEIDHPVLHLISGNN